MSRLLLCMTLAIAGCHPRAPGRDPNIVDRKEAYRSAGDCEHGDGYACIAACRQGGPTDACEQACEGGHAASCAELAVRYDVGYVVPRKRKEPEKHFPPDRARAAAMYERACTLIKKVDAAEQAWMCTEAGKRFANGDEESVDPARSSKSYRRGCKLGSADSCLSFAKGCEAAPEHCKENEAAIALARACKLGKKEACSAKAEVSDE